jgi:hypothetical protein
VKASVPGFEDARRAGIYTDRNACATRIARTEERARLDDRVADGDRAGWMWRRGATGATRPLATSADHRRARLAMGVAAALAAVIVLIVIATCGGGSGKSSAATVRAAPANAPLSQQLNTLDRMVDRVSGQ